MELLEAYRRFKESGIDQSINFEEFNSFLITHHSTRLEGSTLVELETEVLLRDGITPKGKPLEHSNMVKDHFDALQVVLREAKMKSMITEAFIKKIGGLVNKTTGKITNTVLGTFDDSKGDYRLANAFAGTDYSLSYDKIPMKIKELVTNLSEKWNQVNGLEDAYNLAFDAHYYLVEIHPFGDGNGRTSRLVMNFIQAWHGFPITPVFSEDKSDYITALKTSRKEESTIAIRKFLTNQAIKYFNMEIGKLDSKDRNISFVF